MTTPPSPRAGLEEAYRNAEYLVGDALSLRLAIGTADPRLDQLLQREGVATGALLTAANPGSQLRTRADNDIALDQLRQQLTRDGVRMLPALGRDALGTWPDEAGVLALGISLPDAVAVARSFGQLAFVWCPIGEAPRLVWCS